MFARFGAAAAVAAPAMKRSRTLRKRREAGRVFDFTKWGLVVQNCGSGSFSWQRRGGDVAVGLWTLSG